MQRSTNLVLSLEGEEERVTVNSDAVARVVGNASPTDPLGAVAIFGPARTGKSFLLSALAQQDGLFRSRSGVMPCTQGVEMQRASLCGGTLCFADCEGSGDRDIKSDVALATPLMVVSQILILNWLGQPQASKIRSQLHLLCSAASNIVARDPTSPILGHLHIVFRDIGQADSEDNKRQCEQIHNLLQQRCGDRTWGAFKSVTIHALPRPHEHCNTDVVHLDRVADAFRTKVDAMRQTILEQLLSTPRLYTIGMLDEVLTAVCDSVAAEQAIAPQGILDSLTANVIAHAFNEATQAFELSVSEIGQERQLLSRSLREVESTFDMAILQSESLFITLCETSGLESNTYDDQRQLWRREIEMYISYIVQGAVVELQSAHRQWLQRVEGRLSSALSAAAKRGEDDPCYDRIMRREHQDIIHHALSAKRGSVHGEYFERHADSSARTWSAGRRIVAPLVDAVNEFMSSLNANLSGVLDRNIQLHAQLHRQWQAQVAKAKEERRLREQQQRLAAQKEAARREQERLRREQEELARVREQERQLAEQQRQQEAEQRRLREAQERQAAIQRETERQLAAERERQERLERLQGGYVQEQLIMTPHGLMRVQHGGHPGFGGGLVIVQTPFGPQVMQVEHPFFSWR